MTFEKVQETVWNYIDRNFGHKLTEEQIRSLKRIAPDVMALKWGVPVYASGFAAAIHRNDFMEVVGTADVVNEGLLKEYAIIRNCCDYPREF